MTLKEYISPWWREWGIKLFLWVLMVIADNLYDTAALSWPCRPLCRNHFPSGKRWLGRPRAPAPAWGAPLCQEEEEKGSASCNAACGCEPKALGSLCCSLSLSRRLCRRRRSVGNGVSAGAPTWAGLRHRAPFQRGVPKAWNVRNGQDSRNRLDIW